MIKVKVYRESDKEHRRDIDDFLARILSWPFRIIKGAAWDGVLCKDTWKL